MSESKAFHRLSQFLRLTDKMVDDVSKSQIAEAARILALQIGHYQRKFGSLPLDETMNLLTAESLTEEEAGWVADGLELLAAVIAVTPDDDQLSQHLTH